MKMVARPKKCVTHTNEDNNNYTNGRNGGDDHRKITLTFAIWCAALTLACVCVGGAQSAAVYSNVNFLAKPRLVPLCSAQQEHFIESDGKDSSVILQFNRADAAAAATATTPADHHKSCTRILSAPSNYGFIVRLILPKIRRTHYHSAAVVNPFMPASLRANGLAIVGGGDRSSSASASSERLIDAATEGSGAVRDMRSLVEKLNSSSIDGGAEGLPAAARTTLALGRTCPVSIFSSLNPHTPQWRIDPCQLEDKAPEMEDPVHLFQGRVRIVWEHGRNKLNSKLMVTALGKGDECRSPKKHQCLRIGEEPILCISKDLVCDGIRHCPNSNEYDSDEDYDLCWNRRRFGEPIPQAMESDIFEHFAFEVFRKLLEPTVVDDETAVGPHRTLDGAFIAAGGGANSTTLRKVTDMDAAGADSNSTAHPTTGDGTTLATGDADGNETLANGGSSHRRNSTRSGHHSDLSKYGPWGYLMLGMLLCGGALLICGLWASASQHAVNNERESALQHVAGAGGGHDQQAGSGAAPPNYDELDPPPAYSVLFPNQKTPSSVTLSSLDVSAIAQLATAITPPAASAARVPPASSSPLPATTVTASSPPPPPSPSASLSPAVAATSSGLGSGSSGGRTSTPNAAYLSASGSGITGSSGSGSSNATFQSARNNN